MFEIVLTISVISVLLAIGLYRVDPAVITMVAAIGIILSAPFFWISAKPLFFIHPALITTLALCRWRRMSRLAFAGLAPLSVVTACAVAMGLFVPRWSEIQALAADHPVIRMDVRLGYKRKRAQPSDSPSANPAAALPSYDEIAEANGVHYHWTDGRGSALASLGRTHASFVEAFAEQEEFGFIRMIHLPPRDKHIRLPEPHPIELPRDQPDSVSAGMTNATSPVGDTAPWQSFHKSQAIDFVNPAGFGLALDGESEIFGRTGATRVRGFQPHAFREQPGTPPAGDDWQLAKLELVSLLKHDPAAVYVSDHLPRMQDLSSDDAQTRPLDGFESNSLSRLLEGETLVAEESRNRIRMLGGLRAAVQCTQCHSVGEGHLLGAFSYEFRRKKPLPPEEEPAPPKPVI